MAKAQIKLPDGTIVNIEGNPDEIKKILSLHLPQNEIIPPIKKTSGKKKSSKKATSTPGTQELDLAELVNATKSSQEFDQIETNVLDRSSVVDRLLLPLYIANQNASNEITLTSGDIAKFLSQFGIHVAQPNIAKNLSSTASKYVITSKVREKGRPTPYRISRKGLAYITSVIKGSADERQV